jgi:multidrug efflux pump subunit AcrB
MVLILFLGLISLSTRISLEIFPSIEPDTISVSVSLRGATPEDVEQGAAIRIEEAVQDLEGIKQISSRSIESGTTVSMEVDSDYSPRILLEEVKNRVGAINTFPPDAEKPLIQLAQRKREVMTVTIAGDYGEKELREFAEQVRDDLLALENVTQVELDGVRSYEIAIEISPDRLRQYKLSLTDVANAVKTSSLDQSAGNVRTKGGDILIRAKGQSYRRNDFAAIVIKTSVDGGIIRLADVANIHDDFEETPLRTRFNGQQAVLIQIYRVGKQSAIAVANDVKNYIREQQHNLPVGMTLSYWDDDSQIVKNRLTTLTNNAIQGGIMVFALLTLFLRPSIAFWVFLGIPISFMGAFLFMPFLGITLNVISLFGFILVLGIVVDDAIVTGENVYRHMRNSESGLDAAISGTREVAIPVTFGVLTTIAAFLPIGFIEGHRGALFAQIPAVVIPVLIFSLLESKFVLPAHLRFIDLNRQQASTARFTQWQQRFADGFENAILKYYQPLLAVCLKHRLTTLASFTGVLIILFAIISSGWMHFVFFPRIQSETARATLTMPAGTPFEVTDRHVQRMTEMARRLQEKYRDPESAQSLILNILATSGASGRGSNGSNVGQVMFEIIPPEQRYSKISSSDLVNEWRKSIGPVPGAETLTYRAEIGRGGDPIDVQLRSNSLATLDEVAQQVRARLATYPTVFDIADTLSDGKQELQVELTEQGYALGLTRANVIRQVRNAFYGAEVQRVQRGRDDVRVFVRYPIDKRNSVTSLEEMLILAPGNKLVPLANIARLNPGKSASTIYRIDHFRTANVTADIDKTATNMTVLQADLAGFLNELVAKYRGVSYRLEGEAREQRESFGSLGIGLIFVLFTIYSLLAIPLKSFVQPIIVMSVIPFGAIGAIGGHWIMGMDLSLMSLLGLMALVGVVVNDSLVLVDFINKSRNDRQESLMQAVITAGAARFRPVMLTSLTTFFGLMPLLFEKSTQAQFLIPMAVSLGFGIMFATFITLFLVPVNYLLVEDVQAVFPRRPVD